MKNKELLKKISEENEQIYAKLEVLKFKSKESDYPCDGCGKFVG